MCGVDAPLQARLSALGDFSVAREPHSGTSVLLEDGRATREYVAVEFGGFRNVNGRLCVRKILLQALHGVAPAALEARASQPRKSLPRLFPHGPAARILGEELEGVIPRIAAACFFRRLREKFSEALRREV